MKVTTLSPHGIEEILEVLCDAFRNYPVMRYILGDRHGSPEDLFALIRLFVSARILRREPVMGVRAPEGSLVGVATLTPPGERPVPQEFSVLREKTWALLGDDARTRYETFAAATGPFAVREPHWHVNMLGVRRAFQGGGVGRVLLEHVHHRSDEDPRSGGVSLTTEAPENVPLYEHFGYRVGGYTRVTAEFETWTLFRPSPGGD